MSNTDSFILIHEYWSLSPWTLSELSLNKTSNRMTDFVQNSLHEGLGEDSYKQIVEELSQNRYSNQDLEILCEKMGLGAFFSELCERRLQFHIIGKAIFERWALKTGGPVDKSELKDIFRSCSIFKYLLKILDEPVTSVLPSETPPPLPPKVKKGKTGINPMSTPNPMCPILPLPSIPSVQPVLPLAPPPLLPNPEIFEMMSDAAAKAQRMLKDAPAGTFLVRESSSMPSAYALDVKSATGVDKVLIKTAWCKQGQVFSLDPTRKEFLSIDDLLSFYSAQNLSWLPIQLEQRLRPTQLSQEDSGCSISSFSSLTSSLGSSSYLTSSYCSSEANAVDNSQIEKIGEILCSTVPTDPRLNFDRTLAHQIGVGDDYQALLSEHRTIITSDMCSNIRSMLRLWREKCAVSASVHNMVKALRILRSNLTADKIMQECTYTLGNTT